jgi:dTDP-4-dehydrorhamnose reductase
MTILVIGETGQVARSLVQEAGRRGVELLAAGRPTVDLQDAASIVAALDRVKPSLVVNAAAYTAVDKAETEPELAFAANGDGVGHLGFECARRDIPVVHLSTDYVFDGAKPSAYVETDPVAPINVYGQSKLAGETKLRETHAKHIIIRTAWVYSPFGANFLKTMLRVGSSRPEVSVVNDQRGNPTYAPHLAEAILAIAERLQKHDNAGLWGTYHAAGAGDATWYEFAATIFDAGRRLGLPLGSAVPITTEQYPTPAKRPANSRLDCSLLQQRFGVQLPDWRLGTRACIEQLVGQEQPR